MSIKLYNGYKLNNLSMIELKEFIDELRNRLHEIYVSQYKMGFQALTTSLVDTIIVHDYFFSKTKNSTSIENYLIQTLQNAYLPSWIIDNFHKRKNITLNSAIERLNMNFTGSIEEIVKDTICNMIFVHNTKKMSNGIFDFQNEFVYFPIENKILFLAYGNTFEKLLQQIIDSRKKKDKLFREKYGFEYYGYWNNTDKPEKITNKKWNERYLEWEAVLGSDSIPSKHGICSEIITEESFLDEMDMEMIMGKFEFKNISTPKERAEKKSWEIIRRELTEKQNINEGNVTESVELFEKLKSSGSFDGEVNSLKCDLEKLFPVIDNKTIKTKLIDFAPNYKKVKNIS